MALGLDVLNAAQLSFLLNKPTALLWQNSSQSVTSGNTFSTVVTWDQSSNDNYSGHSPSVNPSRYTVQVAGLYAVSSSVSYHGSTGLLVRALALQVNGSILSGSESFNQSYSNNFCTVASSGFLVACSVGDYIEANTWQNSGGSLALVASACYMSVQFVHF